MPYGHQSHQIGLDVDIWMYPPKSLKLTKSERDKLDFMSVRKDNLKEVLKSNESLTAQYLSGKKKIFFPIKS